MGKHWPEPNEMGLEWTSRYPRPKENGPHHPALLEDRQREWDAAETVRVKHVAKVDKIRDDREAKRQAERAAVEAEAEARRQKQNGETEQMLRRRFLAAGGSEAEWQAERAEVISEHRRRLIAEGDATEQAKRKAQAVLYQNF